MKEAHLELLVVVMEKWGNYTMESVSYCGEGRMTTTTKPKPLTRTQNTHACADKWGMPVKRVAYQGNPSCFIMHPFTGIESPMSLETPEHAVPGRNKSFPRIMSFDLFPIPSCERIEDELLGVYCLPITKFG